MSIQHSEGQLPLLKVQHRDFENLFIHLNSWNTKKSLT